MYRMCNDCVTILRGTESLQMDGCCLQEVRHQRRDELGTWADGEFLLIVPGDRPIYPGDRVCWEGGIMTIRSVMPCCMGGRLCHREGRGG